MVGCGLHCYKNIKDLFFKELWSFMGLTLKIFKKYANVKSF